MTPEEKNLLAKIWQSIRRNQAASYSHVFMDDLISLLGIIDRQGVEIEKLQVNKDKLIQMIRGNFENNFTGETQEQFDRFWENYKEELELK